jgi:hypothetical protein
MRQCTQTHKSCQSKTNRHTPTGPGVRLIDLSSYTTTGCVRLVEGLELSTLPQYAALSYVWGQAQNQATHQTTISNYEDHKQGLELSTLPKTFQDAIVVSKMMKLRYLWVDRYCIIQDDEKDITEQLSIMPSIYANAYITISAALAGHMNAGFLEDHTPFEGQQFDLRCRTPFFSTQSSKITLFTYRANSDPVNS